MTGWEERIEKQQRKRKKKSKRSKVGIGTRKMDSQSSSNVERMFGAYDTLKSLVSGYVIKLESVTVELPTLQRKREKKLKAAHKLQEEVEKLWSLIKNCEQ